MTKPRIRVLVVEDSPTTRRLLVETLESDPAIAVAGEAASGGEGVEMAARLAPDLVTMDVQMPGMDGLQATREIMRRAPTPIIIVTALADSEVALSFEATRAGALMVLPKPVGPLSDKYEAQRAQLVAMVKAMSQVKVVRRWGGDGGAVGRPSARRDAEGTPPRAVPAFGAPAIATARLVAIGVSTGGPAALRDLFAALPASFPAPVLVVQHIARGFVGVLAHWLSSSTALRVKVAEEGEIARPGTVYFAPDDRHLGVRHGLQIALSSAPPVGAFRPSATHLFASCARVAGADLVALILTGMGDDGLEGLRAVRAAGGRVLAQDEASCVVYGMPREAVREGLANAVVPLAEMAQHVMREVG